MESLKILYIYVFDCQGQHREFQMAILNLTDKFNYLETCGEFQILVNLCILLAVLNTDNTPVLSKIKIGLASTPGRQN